jgi:hypothetical protein
MWAVSRFVPCPKKKPQTKTFVKTGKNLEKEKI